MIKKCSVKILMGLFQKRFNIFFLKKVVMVKTHICTKGLEKATESSHVLIHLLI